MDIPTYPGAAINIKDRPGRNRKRVTLCTRAACGHVLEATAGHRRTEHARAVAWRRLRALVKEEERRCSSWPWT